MKAGQKLQYIGKGFIGFNPDFTDMEFIEREGTYDYWVFYITDNGKFKMLVRESDVKPINLK